MWFIIALASCDGGIDLIVPVVVSGLLINYVMVVWCGVRREKTRHG